MLGFTVLCSVFLALYPQFISARMYLLVCRSSNVFLSLLILFCSSLRCCAHRYFHLLRLRVRSWCRRRARAAARGGTKWLFLRLGGSFPLMVPCAAASIRGTGCSNPRTSAVGAGRGLVWFQRGVLLVEGAWNSVGASSSLDFLLQGTRKRQQKNPL